LHPAPRPDSAHFCPFEGLIEALRYPSESRSLRINREEQVGTDHAFAALPPHGDRYPTAEVGSALTAL